MGTIEEFGLNLVHEGNRAIIFLPEDFPFSAQSIGSTLEAIRGLFGTDAWGSMSAGFTEETGMGLMFYLPEGKEDESLELVRTASLPLAVTQPEHDKPQLKMLAIHDEAVLIEPSQVITSTQIRELIRTRPQEIQEIANGYWRVSLRDGYLKLHTQHGSFGFSRLDSYSGVLTPNYPYVTEHVAAYVYTDDSVRTGTVHLRVRLEQHVTLDQDILNEAAALPGFTDIASAYGEITAEYTGPEALIIHPINQATALREVVLDFLLKLGIFPAKAILGIGLPTELNKETTLVMNFPLGVVSGRYSYPI